MGTIIALAMGAGAIAFIIWVLGLTYYSIGSFGFFTGGKARFSGIADARYKSNSITLKDAKNLNGNTRRTLTAKRDINYIIKCDINNKSGDIIITLKDKSDNIIEKIYGNVNENINFSSRDNEKIFVYIEVNKFYGDISCQLIKK